MSDSTCCGGKWVCFSEIWYDFTWSCCWKKVTLELLSSKCIPVLIWLGMFFITKKWLEIVVFRWHALNLRNVNVGRHNRSCGVTISWSRHTAYQVLSILYVQIRVTFEFARFYAKVRGWCDNELLSAFCSVAVTSNQETLKVGLRLWCRSSFFLDGNAVRYAISPQIGRKLIEPDRWR